MIEQTTHKMRLMRLSQMAQSLEERFARGELRSLPCEEMLSLLVDDEWAARQNRKLARAITKADFRPEGACLENVIYNAKRGFTKQDVHVFRTAEWIRAGHNVLLFGATGAGKSYLAEAICVEACKLGYSVTKITFKRLLEEIRRARATGQYLKFAEKIKKTGVLLLDDFAMATLGENELSDLAEMLDERTQRRPVVVTSQYPMETWLERLPEPTMAEAICDRLKHNAYTFKLKGESMRTPKTAPKVTGDE
ncbi:MAG: IS21-like element helper ATPase IstB [Fibrobacteria bacterium]